MSETSNISSTSPTGQKPVDSPHTCFLCGAKIRKNKESYRGIINREMLEAIRREKPTFHVKQDICKACGEKWYNQLPKAERKSWMLRPLG